MFAVAYSPNGRHLISGSADRTCRIWDAETGVAVGEPLRGHTEYVLSVAYSPNGQHIISGSQDNTTRIWDARTGAAVGKPLEGHRFLVSSVAYSPDGRHVISGSWDRTIRIWDAETGAMVGVLMGHGLSVLSVASSPDGRHIVSASSDGTIRTWDSFPQPSPQPNSSCNPISPHCSSPPDSDGWVRDSEGGLLYWVPQDCRAGLHSPALLTIPPKSHLRSVSLAFEDFAFGTYWTQTFGDKHP